MQHPLFNGIDGGGTTEERALREAWTHVLEGFRKALTVEGLPPDERATLLDCYRGAAEIAGRPLLQSASRQSAQP